MLRLGKRRFRVFWEKTTEGLVGGERGTHVGQVKRKEVKYFGQRNSAWEALSWGGRVEGERGRGTWGWTEMELDTWQMATRPHQHGLKRRLDISDPQLAVLWNHWESSEPLDAQDYPRPTKPPSLGPRPGTRLFKAPQVVLMGSQGWEHRLMSSP